MIKLIFHDILILFISWLSDFNCASLLLHESSRALTQP